MDHTPTDSLDISKLFTDHFVQDSTLQQEVGISNDEYPFGPEPVSLRLRDGLLDSEAVSQIFTPLADSFDIIWRVQNDTLLLNIDYGEAGSASSIFSASRLCQAMALLAIVKSKGLREALSDQNYEAITQIVLKDSHRDDAHLTPPKNDPEIIPHADNVGFDANTP